MTLKAVRCASCGEGRGWRVSFLRQDNYDSYNFDSREQSQEIIDWAFLNVPNGSYKIEWYSVFFENEEDAAMCYLAYR